MKRTIVVLFGLTVMLLAPGQASGHQGDPNYRSEVTGFVPANAAEGVTLQVKNFDDGLELVNRSGKVVIVEGYDGEPYLRFDPSGVVEVNLNSPAHYLNQDRYADAEIPERADSGAEPDWKQIDDTGVAYWHDHRSHYMGEGTPPQVGDESVETKVFDYRIPLLVDGKRVVAQGTLTWVGRDEGFPVLPFVGLAVLGLAAVVAGTALRRRRIDGDPDDGTPGEREAW